MVFWSRLRQSKLHFSIFSYQLKRCYTLNHGPIITSRSLAAVLDSPNVVSHRTQLEFFVKVRSYAAPVQARKKEERDESEVKLNEQITAPSVRLVVDEDHFVISRYEALARAKSLNMDLVLVDRTATPPVCKIYDYHREKYLIRLKEKERSKSKTTLKKACKEIRFAAKIKPKDLQIKADMVKRLMESGYRVKCTAIEPTNNMDLETLLSQFSALIEDIAVQESGPQVEKKQAYIVVRHVKFGPAKKGSGKKAVSSQTGSESSKTERADSEELLGEDVQNTKSEWADFDGDNDIDAAFDINDEDKVRPKYSEHEQSPVIAGSSPYSAGRNTPSVPIGVPKQPIENRYARDSRAGNPPRAPTESNGSGARNRISGPHQIPAQVRQPQVSMNSSPERRPPAQVPHEVYKKDTSRDLPTKSFGIFTGQQVKNTPREQNQPAESNRYKKSGPSESGRSPRSTGFPPQRGPGGVDNPRPGGVDNPRQGRWGAFSRDNPNVIPNNNENQAEIRRR